MGKDLGDIALNLLADLLGAEVIATGPPRSPLPVTGPCSRCGASTTVYGPGGRPCVTGAEKAGGRDLPRPPAMTSRPEDPRAARGLPAAWREEGTRWRPEASTVIPAAIARGSTTAPPARRLAIGDALTIAVRSERDHAIATIAGEIDISTVSQLRERLAELAARRRLVIDLNQVTFIDAAGLSALVAAANRAAAHGTSLHVVCARPKILELFRLTGLDRRLPPAPTVDEVLAGPGS